MCEGVHMNMGGRGGVGGGGDLGVHGSVHLKPCCNLQALWATKAQARTLSDHHNYSSSSSYI